MARISSILSVCVLGFAMLGACATAPDPVVVEQERVAAFNQYKKQAEFDIRKLLSAQEAAWNRADLDGFMEGYLPTEELRFGGGDNITWGYAETLERYKSKYDSAEKMGQLSLEVQELKLFTETDALVFGRWFLSRPATGDANGLFTIVLEKQNGQWLIVSDHSS